MNKSFVCVMGSIVISMTALASSIGQTMGDVETVIIERGAPDEEPDGRPRVPALRLFSAFLDTDLNILSITSRINVGDIQADIINLSTDEYVGYSFDSSETAILPISGDPGYWKIVLTLDNGEVFFGVFQL